MFEQFKVDCYLTELSAWHSAGDSQQHGQLCATESSQGKMRPDNATPRGLIKTVAMLAGVDFIVLWHDRVWFVHKRPNNQDAHTFRSPCLVS